MATQVLSSSATPVADPFPINGTDYVEFYVGNAKQASHYYRTAFGFQLVGYRGPETGVRDRASYLMVQGKIRFVLTSALHPEHPIAEHHVKHGDGVKDLALWVDDCRQAYEYAMSHGATSVQAPTVFTDADGEIQWHWPAIRIQNLIRAFHDWPDAKTCWRGQRFRLRNASVYPRTDRVVVAPGTVDCIDPELGISVMAGDGRRVLVRDLIPMGLESQSWAIHSITERFGIHEGSIFGDIY